MKAWRIVAGISCRLILATGCGMGQHPYYYCGPVWSQGVCSNCDLDYRAGSVLNRRGPGVLAGESAPGPAAPAPRDSEPPPRAAQPSRVTARRSDGYEAEVRGTTVAQQRQAPRRLPAEQPIAQAPAERALVREAPARDRLPPGASAAPPGTREGQTRILSVADRRLDQRQGNPQSVAAKGQAPQPRAEKPGEDFGGWRPVAPHQDPPETASRLREIDR